VPYNTNAKFLFGGRYVAWNVIHWQGRIAAGYGSSNNITVLDNLATTDTIFNIDYNQNVITVNGTTHTFTPSAFATTNRPIYLFATSTNGSFDT
jgi:hypothetical protein